LDYLLACLTGGAGVAIVTGVFKLLEKHQSHKVGNSKEKQKVIEDAIKSNTGAINHLNEAIRAILHDRIKYLSRAYMASGSVTYDDRRDLIEMHKIYHDALGGNGNLDALMNEVIKIKVI
jgi:hypothetical protein